MVVGACSYERPCRPFSGHFSPGSFVRNLSEKDGQRDVCLGLVAEDSFRKPWVAALEQMTVDPGTTFHDLRPSSVANARRSGVAHEVVQSIVGRKNLMKSVSERYGKISNEVLVQAIDRVSFDHGPTEIMVTRSRKEKADKGSALYRLR